MVLRSTKWNLTCLLLPGVQNVCIRFQLKSLHITYVINSCNIDVNSTSTQALVTQVGGRARLINVRRDSDGKGNVEQIYCMKDEAVVPKMSYEFGAVFINQGQTVLFGSVDGCVFVWDKYKGDVVCVLDHCEGRCAPHILMRYLTSGI